METEARTAGWRLPRSDQMAASLCPQWVESCYWPTREMTYFGKSLSLTDKCFPEIYPSVQPARSWSPQDPARVLWCARLQPAGGRIHGCFAWKPAVTNGLPKKGLTCPVLLLWVGGNASAAPKYL